MNWLEVSLQEIIVAAILFVWIIIVVQFISRKTYEYIRSKNASHRVAVYYARKLIHVLAGGLAAIVVPFFFKTPLIPAILAVVLAILTYIPHKTGKLMEWFQVPENIYEVHFCIMWGVVMTIAWLIFNGNFFYGVIPASFMAFGDGITGVVRNLIYKRRTKAWIGNIAMAFFCIPVGLLLAGYRGALAGILASIVEHFEFGVLDDNITVPLTALLTLIFIPI